MSSASTISLSSMQSKPVGEKWLFSEEQLGNTPSRRENIAPAKELNYRQQAANLIQDMGQRLPVNQLTINTAIVYMHRFYMFHSFPTFSRFSIAPTALFLAAKVEEQPRKLEHVIKVCHSCLKPNDEPLDVHSDDYLKQAQELVEHELIMLQTLGFDISIDHPHTHVVKCTQLVKASKDLSQMAYFMATNSLHLTTFCLKYKPTVVSAMCIHLSCKWSNYEIPLSSEGKAYWTYMDNTITEALLENIISEFLKILELCPTRLRKLKNYRPSTRDGSGKSTSQSKDHHPNATSSKVISGSATSSRRPLEAQSQIEQKKPPTSLTFAEYKNKRDKELKQQQQSTGKPSNRPEISKAGQNVLKGNHPSHVPTGQNIMKGNHPNHVATGQSVTKGMHSNLIPTSSKPSTTSSSRQVKPDGHPAKHDEKVHLNLDNHKRIDKSAGIPGLQRPKNPSIPSSSHHVNQRDKDHPRLQTKHFVHQDVKPAAKPHDKLLVPRLKEDHTTIRNKAPVTQARSNEPEDTILAGMEQKVMEQMNATKVKEVPKIPPAMPFGKPEPPNSQMSAKEQKPKQGRANLPVQKDGAGKVPVLPELPKTYQGLYEMYKKHPDVLGHQLKLKIQAGGLSEDEKVVWHKLRKSEDRRRKKKHEKQKLSKSHHDVNDGERAGPSSGSLTVRIKLPSSARTEALKSGASSDGSQLTSNSGSDTGRTSSPAPGSLMKAGRKRTHAHDNSLPVAAKHSKKTEGHHHESHDQTKHRHKHNRSGLYHHSKHSSASQIDDTTFRQALSDAVTLVQTGQTALASGSERAVPTVTLKRAETKNGGKEGYIAGSSKQEEIRPTNRSKQLGFDPSAPVSATPPENLFDAETTAQSRTNHITQERAAELSSPEMGEIIDDDDDETPDQLSDHNSNIYRHTSFKPSGSMNDRAKSYNRPDSHKVTDKSLPNFVPTNFKRSDQRT